MTTVLVEGESDRVAVETLARRAGLDLAGSRTRVVAMGGATSVVHHLPAAPGERVLGLCDEAEAPGVLRALDRAGAGRGRWRTAGSASVAPTWRTS